MTQGDRPDALLARLIGSIMVLSSANAAAQTERPAPRTSSLSWIRLAGAEECVSTQELARNVEERLGRAVFVSPARADVSVEGHIERGASLPGWTATITLRDAKGAILGTRELHRDDARCAEMREPIALVIAVMIDPDAALRPPATGATPPEHPPTQTPVATPSPTPAPPAPVTSPVSAPASPDPWRFDAGASIIGGLGLLPNAALGLMAGGLLEPPHFVPLQAFGAAWFDNTVSAPGPGRATFSLLSVGGGICPLTWRRERLSAYACVDGEAGLITSRGSGFDQPKPDERGVYLAGALEGRLSVRVIGPLAVRAGISGIVPLSRDRFVYRKADGSTEALFRMSPVVATGDLGVGVVLP